MTTEAIAAQLSRLADAAEAFVKLTGNPLVAQVPRLPVEPPPGQMPVPTPQPSNQIPPSQPYPAPTDDMIAAAVAWWTGFRVQSGAGNLAPELAMQRLLDAAMAVAPRFEITEDMVSRAVALQGRLPLGLTLLDQHANARRVLEFAVLGKRPI